MKILRKLLSCVLLVTLAACGGGGGGAGDSPFGGGNPADPDVPVAADLTISLNSTSVPNTGSVSVAATITAVNAQRVALAGIPITVSVDNAALAVVGASATDASGVVTADVSIGSNRSNRVITVTASSGGITRTAAFAVTGARLAGTATPVIVTAGSQADVRFRLTDSNSNPMALEAITVTAPGLTTVQGTTDANGEYLFQYTVPSITGTLAIAGSAGGVTVSVPVQVGSATVPNAVGTVTSPSVAANPSVVTVNSAGSTTNQTVLRALFVGANNAPIANIRVRFDLNGDANSIGGSFGAGANYVYSNANGVATTAYIPASRSSPTDGVTIRACWDYADFAVGTCPNAVTNTLTVTDEALSVTIGTDNTLQVGSEGLTYIKRFAVLVVDAAGQARADIQITPSIDLERYHKGEYGYLTPSGRDVTPDAGFTFVCANEDINRNGVLEASGPAGAEDVNFNGQLDPRKADVSIRVLGSSRTNASGLAVVQIEYPKSHATWLDYNILVAAGGISGTEGRANYRGTLPALSTDAPTSTVSAPFQRSPYGVSQSTYVTKQVSGSTLTYHDGSSQLFCTQQ